MRTPIAATRVDPNVKPQPQAPTAGVASMNRGLRSLDQGMASLDAQLQERERKNGELWAAKKLAEAKSHWTKTAAERELAADGDAAGYADAMDKDFAAYSDGVLAEAPNRYAKERLEIGLVNVGGKVGASARVFEATRRVATRLDAVTTTINTEVNNVLSGEAFEDSLANTEAAIKAADLPADKEAALLRSTRSNMAESHLRARMRTDPVGVLKDLEDGKYDSYLSPPAKEQLFNAVRTDAGRAIGEAAHDAKRSGGADTREDPNAGPETDDDDAAGGVYKPDPKPSLGKTYGVKTNSAMKPMLSLDGRQSRMTHAHAGENMKRLLNGKFKALQSLFGGELVINDAIAKKGTSRERNTPNSQHFHGNAIDVSLAGMSDADKIRLVKSAVSAGFTGFGFGRNILHIDVGPKRSWTYKTTGSTWGGTPISVARSIAAGAKGGGVAGGGGTFEHIKDVRVRAAARSAYAAREAEANRERRAFLTEFDDELAFLSEGNAPPPDSKYTRQTFVDMFGPVDGERLYARKERAIEDGELWKDVRTMPREVLAEKRAELVAATKDPSLLEEDGRHKEATARLATFDGMVAKREAAIAKDPAGYALAAMPGLQVAAKNIEEHPRMYADLMLQGQAGIGIAEPKILTGPMAAAMVKDIATTNDDKEGFKIAAMAEQWGKHWPQVLKEMRDAGLSGAQYLAAAYVEKDPTLSEEIIGFAATGQKKIADQLKSDEVSKARDGITEALQKYTSAALNSQMPGSGAEEMGEVRETMLTWAYGKMLTDSIDGASRGGGGRKSFHGCAVYRP